MTTLVITPTLPLDTVILGPSLGQHSAPLSTGDFGLLLDLDLDRDLDPLLDGGVRLLDLDRDLDLEGDLDLLRLGVLDLDLDLDFDLDLDLDLE